MRVFEFKCSGFEARKTDSDPQAFQISFFWVFEFKYSGFEALKHTLTHTLFRSQLFLKVFEFKYSGFEAPKTHSDPHACFSDLNLF